MIFFVTSLSILIKILFVYNLAVSKSFKRSIIYSFIYSILFWSFLFSLLPLSKFETSSNFLDFVFILIIVLCFSVLHTVYAITFLSNNIFKKYLSHVKYNIFVKSFIFAFLLCVSELFISSLMSVFTNGSYTPDYAFVNVGYALSYSPFIYIAKYLHVYGLTFLLGIIIYLITNSKSKINYILDLNPLLLSTLKIKTKLNLKFKILHILFFLFCSSFYFSQDKNILEKLPDNILVKNEDARYVTSKNRDKLAKRYDLIVDGNTEYFDGNLYNVSHIYDNKNGIEYKNYKRFLMPFGEYMPSYFEFVKYFNADIYNSIKNRHTYTSVENKNNVFSFDGKVYATLLCSDAWSPISTYKIKKQNPDILILQRREVLFHNSPIYQVNVNMWKNIMVRYMSVPVIDVNN